MTRKEEIEKEAIKQCTFKVKGNDGYVDTIDNTQYKGFIAGAEWANKTMIEKACKWLEYNFNMPNDFKEHFTKAMIEE